MRLFTTMIFATCLSMNLCGQITFVTTIDSTNGQPNAIVQTYDGGYVVIGKINDYQSGESNNILLRLNDHGLLEWTKILPDSIYNIYSIVETKDNSFLILGESNNYGWGGFDLLLIKTDNMGSVIWTKTFGGTNKDRGVRIRKTVDGGYIIGGTVCSFGDTNGDGYLIRVDDSANIQWAKAYGSSVGFETEHTFDIIQTEDEGFVGVGNTENRPYANGVIDPYIFKTDSVGNLEWAKMMGDRWVDQAYAVQQMMDGGIIVAWNSVDTARNTDNTILAKLDNVGNTIWTKAYDVSMGGGLVFLEKAFNGGIQMLVSDVNKRQPVLVEVDTNGSVLTSRIYKSPFPNTLTALQSCLARTSDGYILGCLIVDTIPNNPWKMVFIKTDEDGIANCSDSVFHVAVTDIVLPLDTFVNDSEFTGDSTTHPIIASQSLTLPYSTICLDTLDVSINKNEETFDGFKLYPNPFNSTITIELKNPIHLNLSLRLFNILGSEIISKQGIGTDKTEIQLIDLPNGLYVYRITNDQRTLTMGKIIKE